MDPSAVPAQALATNQSDLAVSQAALKIGQAYISEKSFAIEGAIDKLKAENAALRAQLERARSEGIATYGFQDAKLKTQETAIFTSQARARQLEGDLAEVPNKLADAERSVRAQMQAEIDALKAALAEKDRSFARIAAFSRERDGLESELVEGE